MDTSKYLTLSQTQPHEKTSSKYSLIPTSRALTVLQDHGWMPAKVNEARIRKESNRGFQSHMVRLRQPKDMNANINSGEFPEIVLINSHMGSASFQIMLGFFRLVCSNGAIAGENVESYRIRHVGFTEEKFENALSRLISQAPKVIESVNSFKSIELTSNEQKIYAQSAIELVRGEDNKFSIDPSMLVAPRRSEDRAPSLWNTFNIVQEKFIRGGLRVTRQDGRRTTMRAVKSIDKDVAINRALWTLTEKMAQLKTGNVPGVSLQ